MFETVEATEFYCSKGLNRYFSFIPVRNVFSAPTREVRPRKMLYGNDSVVCPQVRFKKYVLPHLLNIELDRQSLFGLHVHSCSHWLRPRIWAHIRGRYWSAKIDGNSLWPPGLPLGAMFKNVSRKVLLVQKSVVLSQMRYAPIAARKAFYVISAAQKKVFIP